MYILIVFLPLFAACLAGFGGRYLGNKGAQIITIFALFLAVLLAGFAFYTVGLQHNPSYIHLYPWINVGTFQVNWGFLFDELTVTMCLMVTFISLLVHTYSIDYMATDPHQPRFMAYLSLFTFFMLVLVSGDNLVQLFVGWEGVGLCSYLLINFWYSRDRKSVV